MQSLEIREGQLIDVQNTLQMFVAITDDLLEKGIDQWNYDYPDVETLIGDVERGENYVIGDSNKISASLVLNAVQDIQYQKIHWKFRNDSVLNIHRLGVHPESQGTGLGKKMCLFAESFARAHHYKSIRLDTYAGNIISNNFYKSLGYIQANGYCYFRKKAIPFYCYEKKIE